MSPKSIIEYFLRSVNPLDMGGDLLIFNNIRKRCVKGGISIYALEKKLEFGNGTISSWATSSPSVDKLKRVADYFGVTVDELLKCETEQKGEL